MFKQRTETGLSLFSNYFIEPKNKEARLKCTVSQRRIAKALTYTQESFICGYLSHFIWTYFSFKVFSSVTAWIAKFKAWFFCNRNSNPWELKSIPSAKTVEWFFCHFEHHSSSELYSKCLPQRVNLGWDNFV